MTDLITGLFIVGITAIYLAGVFTPNRPRAGGRHRTETTRARRPH